MFSVVKRYHKVEILSFDFKILLSKNNSRLIQRVVSMPLRTITNKKDKLARLLCYRFIF